MSTDHLTTAKKEESAYHRSILDSPETLQSLDLLLEIVNTCRGPNGRIKIIQNNSGGHMTITSASKRLFAAVSVSMPINRMIVSAAQGHLNACSDGGLFVVSLCSLLIKHSLSERNNRLVLIKLYEKFLEMCLKYLDSSSNPCKSSSEISNLSFLTSFVKNILFSKPQCEFHKKSLAKLLVEAFLFSIPDDFNNFEVLKNIRIICFDTDGIDNSEFYKGLLLEAPEIHALEEIDLKFKLTNEKCIKTVVVTASMSGDLDVIVDAKYEVDGNVDIEWEILQFLEKFCIYLISENVGIVFCQKVIHPRLKLQMRAAGIMVIDRLGLQCANYTIQITGAEAVQSFVVPLWANEFGKVSSARHIILSEKNFLFLTAERKQVGTLVFYSYHEETVQEIKDVGITALSLLERFLYHPGVLMGAGCWQTHMASVLRKQVLSLKRDFSKMFDCSISAVTSACKIFSRCLEILATTVSSEGEELLTDNSYLHLWRVPQGEGDKLVAGEKVQGVETCSCGLIKWDSSLKFDWLLERGGDLLTDNSDVCPSKVKVSDWESVVVDSESVSVNAFKTAILTACTVLQIRQFVENLN